MLQSPLLLLTGSCLIDSCRFLRPGCWGLRRHIQDPGRGSERTLLQDQDRWGLEESSIMVLSSSICRAGVVCIMQPAENLLLCSSSLLLDPSCSLASLQTAVFPSLSSLKESRAFHKQMFRSYNKFCTESSTEYKNHYNLSSTEEASNFIPTGHQSCFEGE